MRVRNCDGTSYLSFARTRAHAQHIGWKTHRHHHKMLKWNAWIGCDNEHTRSYTFRYTIIESKLKERRMQHSFRMYTACSTIVLYPSDTYRRDVGGNHQTFNEHSTAQHSTPHTSWINRLQEMLHFYRINNIGHRDDDSFKMLEAYTSTDIFVSFNGMVWNTRIQTQ